MGEKLRRCPYVAIVAAGEAGSGVTLTAEEAFELCRDDAIATAARNGLNDDGEDMVRRFGWGHLRYIARNIRATRAQAMKGLPAGRLALHPSKTEETGGSDG